MVWTQLLIAAQSVVLFAIGLAILYFQWLLRREIATAGRMLRMVTRQYEGLRRRIDQTERGIKGLQHLQRAKELEKFERRLEDSLLNFVSSQDAQSHPASGDKRHAF